MKLASLFAAFTLSVCGVAFAAEKHKDGHEIKPMHGGVVAEVKHLDYELVAKADVLQLYVRDHGKPLNLTKASAKITMLIGTEKQEVTLKPVGDRLEAKGSFKVRPGAKVVALVVMDGKSSSARFVLK